MDAFELDAVIAQHGESGEAYLQFLSRGSLSLGLYVLPAGGDDAQSPHAEDEVYYVVSGRAAIRVGDEDRPVRAGSMVFVAKDLRHRFHSIEEELRLLVFFAPEHTPAV
jgi:mannose-6-phosphate isomerase-like protein (cupin superfamily)